MRLPSQDGTVAISRLGESAIARVATYDAGVGNVVKCARWRDAHLLACTGSSGGVALLDTRLGRAASTPLGDASHAHRNRLGAYCVRWAPHDESLLLSVSAREMRLHDLRVTARPLHVLRGHAEAREGDDACKRIFTPTFSHGGRAVTCLGAKSQRLTVYSVADGAIVSQGDLGGRVAASSGGSVLSIGPRQPAGQPEVPEVLMLASGKTFESYVARRA